MYVLRVQGHHPLTSNLSLAIASRMLVMEAESKSWLACNQPGRQEAAYSSSQLGDHKRHPLHKYQK
jgi:hypothetical protein